MLCVGLQPAVIEIAENNKAVSHEDLAFEAPVVNALRSSFIISFLSVGFTLLFVLSHLHFKNKRR